MRGLIQSSQSGFSSFTANKHQHTFVKSIPVIKRLAIRLYFLDENNVESFRWTLRKFGLDFSVRSKRPNRLMYFIPWSIFLHRYHVTILPLQFHVMNQESWWKHFKLILGYKVHRLCAQSSLRVLMNLADSLFLPYNLRRFPEQMKKSLEKLKNNNVTMEVSCSDIAMWFIL